MSNLKRILCEAQIKQKRFLNGKRAIVYNVDDRHLRKQVITCKEQNGQTHTTHTDQKAQHHNIYIYIY